jgi:hypothetical protein
MDRSEVGEESTAVKYRVYRIPLWPVTRVAFVVLLVVGVIIGLFYGALLSGLGIIMGALGESAFGEGLPAIGNLGFLMIPFIAVLYAITGTIWVLVWVLIYNVVAQVTGGIEFELSAEEDHRRESPTHVPERPLNGF